MKSTSPYQQHQVQQSTPRIGYTTQYGNGFNTNSMYGYLQQTTYQGTYTPQAGGSSGPKRASGSRDSGGQGSYDGVTVTYTVKADYLGIYYYTVTYYYPDGSPAGTEPVKAWLGDIDYDYLNSQAEKYAKKWAESHATPIGDAVIPLLILVMCYIGYDVLIKHKKTT